MTSAPVHHPAWQPQFAGWPATQVPHQQSEPQADVSTLTTQQGSPGQPRHHEPDPESNPSRSLPPGTWTIDPADSSVVLAWRTLGLWTTTSRLHGFGVLHLDALPPVGAISFHQASDLPVLTMALNPASGQWDHDLDGTSGCDVSGHQWWTLHSHSLEVLPTGSWRVTATLTTPSGSTLVELHLEVDPTAGRGDLLVMRGHGVLDRRAVDPSRPALGVGPRILLELVLHATPGPATPDRVGSPPRDHIGATSLPSVTITLVKVSTPTS
jgi:hypothetical protein